MDKKSLSAADLVGSVHRQIDQDTLDESNNNIKNEWVAGASRLVLEVAKSAYESAIEIKIDLINHIAVENTPAEWGLGVIGNLYKGKEDTLGYWELQGTEINTSDSENRWVNSQEVDKTTRRYR